jgi:hypothetical protein
MTSFLAILKNESLSGTPRENPMVPLGKIQRYPLVVPLQNSQRYPLWPQNGPGEKPQTRDSPSHPENQNAPRATRKAQERLA